jgi:predicted dehydrogenase
MLLARPDIEAVDIVLPIDVMPDVVAMALQAGKHVVSEKPIAPDVATGRRLLARYAEHPGQVWMVAESWRYEDAFEQAAALIRAGEIGRPLLCDWTLHKPITPDNEYYQTAWRQVPAYPGGYALDAGVHHAAVLRLILGDIREVSAVTAQVRSDLPPLDTLSASLQFANGVLGTYLVTFAVGAPWPPALRITGESGALSVWHQKLTVTREGTPHTLPVKANRAVEAELVAFAQAIRAQQPHRNSPAEALQDLAVIEAMLRSAETGLKVSPEMIIARE